MWLSFISFLKKISLKPLTKKSVLIYDAVGEDILKSAVLFDIDYTVMPVRHEKYAVSPAILFRLAFHLSCLVVEFKKSIFKKYCKALNLAYQMAFIEQIAPKVIITLIDNAKLFHELDQRLVNIPFVTVQNGAKDEKVAREWRQQPITISTYLSFGKYDIDLYEKYGHSVRKPIPAGSLKAGYYTSTRLDNLKIEYDICCVSEFKKQIMCSGHFPVDTYCDKMIHTFLSRYLNENSKKTACIACRTAEDVENEYFQSYYIGLGNIQIVRNSEAQYETYHCMDSSRIIVCWASTAGFEAMGWGKKVLFCNFSGLNEYNFPLPDICRLQIPDYHIFRYKLDHLLGMDDDEYKREYMAGLKYFMNFNPISPPHKILREMVFNIING